MTNKKYTFLLFLVLMPSFDEYTHSHQHLAEQCNIDNQGIRQSLNININDQVIRRNTQIFALDKFFERAAGQFCLNSLHRLFSWLFDILYDFFDCMWVT
ncbi:hypothetical protein AB4K20DRAFT_1160055 [Rhizopus microsporus]